MTRTQHSFQYTQTQGCKKTPKSIQIHKQVTALFQPPWMVECPKLMNLYVSAVERQVGSTEITRSRGPNVGLLLFYNRLQHCLTCLVGASVFQKIFNSLSRESEALLWKVVHFASARCKLFCAGCLHKAPVWLGLLIAACEVFGACTSSHFARLRRVWARPCGCTACGVPESTPKAM